MPVKKKKKVVKNPRVPRTRNANSLTESQFWSKIRSALRNASRFWKPAALAKEKAKQVYKGINKRQKVQYICDICKNPKKSTEVEAHHKIPCGSLKKYSDLPGFVERLFTEDINAFQIICKKCHLLEHKKGGNNEE
jgi:hypothetical protein